MKDHATSMLKMAAVAITCCLCHQELMKGGALKKRKLFHGESCRNTREIVSEIMEKQQQSMASFVETSNPDAFLCHACDLQGAKFSRLLKEAQKVKEGFAEKLSKLTKVPGNNRGQKRVTELHEQGAKRTRSVSVMVNDEDAEGNPIQPCIQLIGDVDVSSDGSTNVVVS